MGSVSIATGISPSICSVAWVSPSFRARHSVSLRISGSPTPRRCWSLRKHAGGLRLPRVGYLNLESVRAAARDHFRPPIHTLQPLQGPVMSQSNGVKSNLRTGGQILVDQLVAQGVERVTCVPGESYLAALDAMHDSAIDVVTCRAEVGAAMMAEAHGKLTRHLLRHPRAWGHQC